MYAATDNNNLADITAVKVDRDLPQAERTADFKRQIKNTSLYKCKGFTIHALYSNNGVHIEDCLCGIKSQ